MSPYLHKTYSLANNTYSRNHITLPRGAIIKRISSGWNESAVDLRFWIFAGHMSNNDQEKNPTVCGMRYEYETNVNHRYMTLDQNINNIIIDDGKLTVIFHQNSGVTKNIGLTIWYDIIYDKRG